MHLGPGDGQAAGIEQIAFDGARNALREGVDNGEYNYSGGNSKVRHSEPPRYGLW